MIAMICKKAERSGRRPFSGTTEGTDENQETPYQDNPYTSSDSIPGLAEYEAEFMTTASQPSRIQNQLATPSCLFLFEFCVSSVTFLARRTNSAQLIQNDVLPSAIFHIPPPAPSHCSSDVRLSRRGNRIRGDTHTCSCRVETLGRGSVHTETKKRHVGFEVLKAMVIKSSVFWDTSQPTLRRNISPPSSGSNKKPSKNLVWSR
jgi:hypothetical protein